MGKYAVHRQDANQSALDAWFEAHGASVVPLGRPVDRAIGYHGITALVEVKTKKGKLEPDQQRFFASFTGLARVIRDEIDAKGLLDEMRIMAVSCRLAGRPDSPGASSRGPA
jgi:hypothetical protein